MRRELSRFKVLAFFLFHCLLSAGDAKALELDWSGQFWSEFNFIHNYAMDNTDQGAGYDAARAAAGGYYVPGGGEKDANFQSLFLRLRPKLVVNDNIYVKSEWWIGNPVFGIFGDALPYSVDQRQYYSSQSRGSFISAQRFWGEFVTDIGTFQVGRVPLHWGLGVVWNSGDKLWDRYVSTGDGVRWVANFGSFSFIPSFIVNSTGNTIAGACSVDATGRCVTGVGSGGVTDYSIIFKYENTEEELEGGINILKRLGGASQDQNYGVLTPQTSGAEPAQSVNFVTYDFFARKKFNQFTFAGEVPIANGKIGAATYQTFGIAGEVSFKATEAWELILKGGHAPGQPGLNGQDIDSYKTFYFNPNYHIGMIMFNYQLRNFAGAQTQNNPNLAPNQLASPYDNPIVNATYAALSSNIKPSDKWTIRPGVVYARAPQTAGGTPYFYNYWDKQTHPTTPDKSQGNSLGWEFDLGLTFQWDEYFLFSFDNGIFLPGDFFAFSNAAQDNLTAPVFATSVRIGVNF